MLRPSRPHSWRAAPFLATLLALACSLTSPLTKPTLSPFRMTLTAQSAGQGDEGKLPFTEEVFPSWTPKPTWTPQPTYTPAPTRTPPATFTPTPTLTANPQDRLAEYALACEAAMQQKPVAAPFVPPMLVLFHPVDEQPDWQLGGLAEEPVAFVTSNADQARALVCVRQKRVQRLTYESGAIGYQRDWDIRVVRWPEGQVIASKFFQGSQPPRMAFVRKGTKVIYGDEPSTQGMLRWLAENMEAPNVLVSGLPVGDIAFAADNRTLYTIYPSATLQAWEIGRATPHSELRINFISPLRLSPDSAFLGGGTLDEGYLAVLADPRSGQKIRRLAGPSGLFNELAFSFDNSTMATSDYNGAIYAWRVKDGQPLPHIEAGLGYKDIALSPDGNLLAAGSGLYDIQIYNINDGSLLRKIKDSGRVIDLAFSPVLYPDGGGLLASAHQDDRVRIWQVDDGGLLATLDDCSRKNSFLQEPLNTGSQLAFSPDGKLLAAACGATWLWRTDDWSLQDRLERFEDAAAVLAFSPDGQWLATGTQRGLVFLWPLSQP